jgi:hypothetical protein
VKGGLGLVLGMVGILAKMARIARIAPTTYWVSRSGPLVEADASGDEGKRHGPHVTSCEWIAARGAGLPS